MVWPKASWAKRFAGNTPRCERPPKGEIRMIRCIEAFSLRLWPDGRSGFFPPPPPRKKAESTFLGGSGPALSVFPSAHAPSAARSAAWIRGQPLDDSVGSRSRSPELYPVVERPSMACWGSTRSSSRTRPSLVSRDVPLHPQPLEFSCLGRRISLRASLVRPSLRRPSSKPACLTRFRIVWLEGSHSRASRIRTEPGPLRGRSAS